MPAAPKVRWIGRGGSLGLQRGGGIAVERLEPLQHSAEKSSGQHFDGLVLINLPVDAGLFQRLRIGPPRIDTRRRTPRGFQQRPAVLTHDDLRRGVLVTCPDRANSVEHRLTEQEVIVGQTQKPDGTIQLKAVTQNYFETDDLASGPGHHM